MLKKLVGLFLVFGLVLSVSALGFAQGEKKQGKVEGRVIRTSAEKSTLTVRMGTAPEKIVKYDASTQWTATRHAEKTAAPIDAAQVKDGDWVICTGYYDEKGLFHAAAISKRLSHSLAK